MFGKKFYEQYFNKSSWLYNGFIKEFNECNRIDIDCVDKILNLLVCNVGVHRNTIFDKKMTIKTEGNVYRKFKYNYKQHIDVCGICRCGDPEANHKMTVQYEVDIIDSFRTKKEVTVKYIIFTKGKPYNEIIINRIK